MQKYPSFTFVIASHPFCSVPESHTNPEPAQSIFVIANEVRQSMPPLFRRWIATACGLAMTNRWTVQVPCAVSVQIQKARDDDGIVVTSTPESRHDRQHG
ncbi:hypothetical protein [Polaromonas sp.]|uniref:hypothetical protein n=1 Tax=Polaromonas sp. TaxID=1869339 RepID=UPI001DBAC96B|nr:hypothetical protein [Polaromonas sp.]MBT9476808.1 hypothetical protein [Polaromonas sp.]